MVARPRGFLVLRMLETGVIKENKRKNVIKAVDEEVCSKVGQKMQLGKTEDRQKTQTMLNGKQGRNTVRRKAESLSSGSDLEIVAGP